MMLFSSPPRHQAAQPVSMRRRVHCLPVGGWKRVIAIGATIAIGVMQQSPASAQATGSDAPAAMTVSKSAVLKNLLIPMRDGTKLAADVYVPSLDGVTPAQGRFPVLLMRTPYGKGSPLLSQPPGKSVASVGTLRPEQAVGRGYAVVVQDVRGTNASQGDFQPMRNEAADGSDTVAWLTKQSWSDGRIGTFGPSYMGGVQMLLAGERPSGLVTAFSQVAATDQFKNEWVYMDGVLAMTGAVWSPLMVDAYVARLPEAERAPLKADYAALGGTSWMTLPPAAFGKILGTLPLTDMPVVRRAPWWGAWLKNRDNPEYFKNNAMAQRFQNIEIPILHLGGWYDLFLRNTYESFKNVSNQAKSPAVRRAQRLIIGQWSHGSCAGCAPNAALDAEALQLAWMDRWFKGKSSAFFEHPVVIYVMGENKWRAETSWPLAGTQRTRYYLHSQGGANTAAGNGVLSASLPQAEAADHFAYDPRNPAPTLGGPGLSGSRAEQNSAESRSDLLVYSSPVLESDTEVTGEISATLYAASSARDTDWWVKLVDVDPNGKAAILTQGVVRARYRLSRVKPSALTPGKTEKYSINMWATSNVFKKGHRIRVEVTSSNFPYADRNPNAFVDLSNATEKDFVVASQTVFHDAGRASFVDLPIIPAARARDWIERPEEEIAK